MSIQEGVDSSATTTNTLAERALLVQVCHIELNAQGVTEPGQQGSQEDPGLLLDHHGLCHYRLLSEHDVNYTKAANVKLTKLWADEARTCSQQAELLDEHMRITWHNVNGITGFIAALSLNSDGYFLSVWVDPRHVRNLGSKGVRTGPENPSVNSIVGDSTGFAPMSLGGSTPADFRRSEPVAFSG